LLSGWLFLLSFTIMNQPENVLMADRPGRHIRSGRAVNFLHEDRTFGEFARRAIGRHSSGRSVNDVNLLSTFVTCDRPAPKEFVGGSVVLRDMHVALPHQQVVPAQGRAGYLRAAR